MAKLPSSGAARRVQRIQHWIEQQRTPGITSLVLERETEGSAWEQIASWERNADLVPADVALAVDRMLVDLADELGARVVARLTWMVAEKSWLSLALKVDPEGGAELLDGSNRSQAQSAQRHVEAIAHVYASGAEKMMQSFAAGSERLLGQALRSNESLLKLIEIRETRAVQLEAELMSLRDENAELRAQLAELEQVASAAIEGQEQAAEELQKRKADSNDDRQVIDLVAKVAQKAMVEPAKAK